MGKGAASNRPGIDDGKNYHGLGTLISHGAVQYVALRCFSSRASGTTSKNSML